MIYLDNNSTTKIDPRVLDAMMPFLKDSYGNASSTHELGNRSHEAVKNARTQVADLINAEPHEIVFTSGATEAINLALKGVAESYKQKGSHIITLATEHPAVLDTCRFLESIGCEITCLPVKEDGCVESETVRRAIRKDTIIVTAMYVNNETGVKQPIKEIAEIAHANGSFFMTDGTQAVGRIPVHVNELGIDLMSLSAHKFYGPKGIGAIYVRSKRPHNVKLSALLHGGGHERGIRSGTINVPGVVGLGYAAKIAQSEMESDAARIEKLRNKLEQELLKFHRAFLNGSGKNRVYNTSNICFEGIDADAVIVGLKKVMVSKGSACSSTSVKPSHVLKAMGRSDEAAFSSIRFSLGKFNTDHDVTMTLGELTKVLSHLKEIAG